MNSQTACTCSYIPIVVHLIVPQSVCAITRLELFNDANHDLDSHWMCTALSANVYILYSVYTVNPPYPVTQLFTRLCKQTMPNSRTQLSC